MIVSPYGNADWAAVLPPLVMAGSALIVLLADLLARRGAKRYTAIVIGLLGAIAAGILSAGQYDRSFSAFAGAFTVGSFTTVFEEIVVISTLGSLILYGAIGREDRIAGAVALMLWSATGALVMAGASNLMTIFLGLELLSLALYCLCGLSDRATAREAALKYLILSSTASGFLLFGMGLLFGASGSVRLADLANPALAGSPLLWSGWGMVAIGLAFKLSLVPFHTWTPDVYEGAPLPVTTFMSVATKAGALAVLARFIYAALPAAAAERLLLPVWIVAAISMIAGNVGMLAQRDLKRLLAYSSVAQVGYILTALAGGTVFGLKYAIYYLAVYMFMNLGAFAVAAALSTDREEGSTVLNYHGLGRRRPLLAAAMTVFLLALAGFPPTAGFLGKILILAESVNAGYAWMAGLLILGTAISLYAYAKVVRLMYAHEEGVAPTHDARPLVPLAWVSVVVCCVAVIVMTFVPHAPSNILPLTR